MFLSLVTFGLLSHSAPPLIWERAANSVYHLSDLSTDVTSCRDFFPLVYCGRSLGSDCISSLSSSSLINIGKCL